MIGYQKAGIGFIVADRFRNQNRWKSKKRLKKNIGSKLVIKMEEESAYVNILDEILLQDAENILRINTDTFEVNFMYHKVLENYY